MKRLVHVIGVTCLSLLTLLVSACDDGRDDHEPATGLGAVQVDNNTSTELAVFVDGMKLGNVDSYKDEAYDLSPGVHRVVLDERGDGNKSDARDVDVLEGKTTVLDVSVPFAGSGYDVVVFFD
jgi:hypothetical protein